MTYGFDFVKGEFACHDQLREAQCLEETRFGGGADVTLRAGVQGYGRQIEAQQSQVLDDECIHPDSVEVMYQMLNFPQFVIIDERIDRGINAGTEAMGIVAGTAHIVEAVGGSSTGSVMGGAHIHSIGAMVDGGDGYGGVTGGRQQFYVNGLRHLL